MACRNRCDGGRDQCRRTRGSIRSRSLHDSQESDPSFASARLLSHDFNPIRQAKPLLFAFCPNMMTNVESRTVIERSATKACHSFLGIVHGINPSLTPGAAEDRRMGATGLIVFSSIQRAINIEFGNRKEHVLTTRRTSAALTIQAMTSIRIEAETFPQFIANRLAQTAAT